MILFGLGNPGLRYRSTRHNAGYLFLDLFAKEHRKRFRTLQGYRITKVVVNGQKVELIKPLCWMNDSGIAVAAILEKRDEDFLVVVDDIALPLGRIRLRAKGSDGGHLGLRSIINILGYSDFPRLRIGVGYNDETLDVASYVLSPFSRSEKKLLRSVMKQGIKGLKMIFTDGFLKAQNYINSVDLTEKGSLE